MRSNKKSVNELSAGDQRFQKGSVATNNRLQWRIRSAAKALNTNAKLESRPAEVRWPIYAIGRDCVATPVSIGLQGKTPTNALITKKKFIAKMSTNVQESFEYACE